MMVPGSWPSPARMSGLAGSPAGPPRPGPARATPAALPVHDTASRHPVFCTERLLQRSPFVAPDAAARTSPVAWGYAAPEVQRALGARL